jgi:hypothetical protein
MSFMYLTRTAAVVLRQFYLIRGKPDWTAGGKPTLLRTLAVLGIAVPRAL